MAQQITLPELGEGITSGTIVNLLVSEGDTISQGQPLVEVETDKAIVEVPAPTAGRITRFLVKSGDTAKVGSPILELEAAAETNGKPKSPKTPAPESTTTIPKTETPAVINTAPNPKADNSAARTPSADTTIALPGLGEGIKGGAVVSLRLQPGETFSAGQALLEVETDKAVVEVPAPASGTLIAYTVKPGDQIQVGEPFAKITTTSAVPPQSPQTEPTSSSQTRLTPSTDNTHTHTDNIAVQQEIDHPPSTGPLQTAHSTVAGRSAAGAHGAALPRAERIIPAGPATRRFARELGVDLSFVTGTGPGGRITIDDVKNFVKTNGVGRAPTAAPGLPAPAPLPDFSLWGQIERQPLTNLRRRIVEQMQLAWTIPMVTQFDHADITDLEAFRKRNAPAFKERGASLTITAFAIKAAVVALKKFPQFNTSLDLARGELILKKYYHIGIAVDTPAGLIVPVIRDADQKSLAQLSLELAAIAKKARDRKITPNELQGATFTISNLGGIGGTQFTPLVNPPQVAILGISRGEIQPRWNGATFEPRLLMPISVSYDHRVVDGADGARFTRAIAEALENYAADLLL